MKTSRPQNGTASILPNGQIDLQSESESIVFHFVKWLAVIFCSKEFSITSNVCIKNALVEMTVSLNSRHQIIIS